MKFSILINQLGIVEAGLHESTDLADWALLEYISDWQLHSRAVRMGDHVWLNYQTLIDEMPMLGLNKKNSVSNRVSKLVGLELLTICHDDGKRTFAKVTDLYLDIVRFRPGDEIHGVPRQEQGVPRQEQGVPRQEHSINNKNNLPGLNNKNTHTENLESVGASEASRVCGLMISHGLVHVNPSHPDLAELIAAGALDSDFEFAAMTASDLGKGFGYALGIVRGRLNERRLRAVSGNKGGKHATGKNTGYTSRAENSVRVGRAIDNILQREFGPEVDSSVVH